MIKLSFQERMKELNARYLQEMLSATTDEQRRDIIERQRLETISVVYAYETTSKYEAK